MKSRTGILFYILPLTAVFFLLSGLPPLSAESGSGLHISGKTRRVLAGEMNAIQNGLTALSIAIPAGKWDDITFTAGNMNKGYLMKRKLTEKELNAFTDALPAGYRDLDSDFHDAAGRVAHAAVIKDPHAAAQGLDRLVRTCIACHMKYAHDRFPGF